MFQFSENNRPQAVETTRTFANTTSCEAKKFWAWPYTLKPLYAACGRVENINGIKTEKNNWGGVEKKAGKFG